MWDNLYAIIILNLGFYIVFAAGLGATYLAVFGLPLIVPTDDIWVGFLATIMLLIIAHVLFNVYAGAVCCVTKDIAHYITPTFASFFKYFKETWKSSAMTSRSCGMTRHNILPRHEPFAAGRLSRGSTGTSSRVGAYGCSVRSPSPRAAMLPHRSGRPTVWCGVVKRCTADSPTSSTTSVEAFTIAPSAALN